jgi:HPr kinase/phosphorylase
MAHPDPDTPRIHGTLVRVVDVGILLLGRSGIGKSECALELVMRGYPLVADDMVMYREENGGVVGWSPDLVRHYLELRGIGIVHVPSLFGETAVMERSAIELVIELAMWEPGEVDRIGLDQRTTKLGSTELAAIHLPVAPGRNIASLVEVAARTFRLQRGGRSVVAELEDRVLARLRGEDS